MVPIYSYLTGEKPMKRIVNQIYKRSQYAYDFIAAPFLAAALHLGTEYFGELGHCWRIINEGGESSCFTVVLIRLFGVLAMLVAGVKIWQLGAVVKNVENEILILVKNIPNIHPDFNPEETQKEIDRLTNETQKEYSKRVLYLFGTIIFFMLLSLLFLFFAGTMIELITSGAAECL